MGILIETFSKIIAKIKKVEYIYDKIDKNYFEGVDKDLFKRTYGLNEYILSVSHIEPRKNHLNLIKGFLEFKKWKNETVSNLDIQDSLQTHIIAGSYNNLKLVLIGDYRGNYFDYHEKVKDLIAKNEDIIHIQNLENTSELFKSSYLGSMAHFLLSSLETPGLSNLEAGLAGNRLILGDCKPVREYFRNFAKYINPKSISSIKKEIGILVYEKLLDEELIIKEDIEKEFKERLVEFVKEKSEV